LADNRYSVSDYNAQAHSSALDYVLNFFKGGLFMLSLCGIIIGFISSICSVDLFIFACCAYAFFSLVSLAMHFVSGKRVIYK